MRSDLEPQGRPANQGVAAGSQFAPVRPSSYLGGHHFASGPESAPGNCLARWYASLRILESSGGPRSYPALRRIDPEDGPSGRDNRGDAGDRDVVAGDDCGRNRRGAPPPDSARLRRSTEDDPRRAPRWGSGADLSVLRLARRRHRTRLECRMRRGTPPGIDSHPSTTPRVVERSVRREEHHSP